MIIKHKGLLYKAYKVTLRARIKHKPQNEKTYYDEMLEKTLATPGYMEHIAELLTQRVKNGDTVKFRWYHSCNPVKDIK